MRVEVQVNLPPLVTFVAVSLLVPIGCVSIRPQEVDLAALREALSRTNELLASRGLNTLPDTWLDDTGAWLDHSGVEGRDCPESSFAKNFVTAYSQIVNRRTDWYVGTEVSVYCSERSAVRQLENACRNGWSRSPKEPVESVVDALGTACITSVVQLRNHGLFPSNTFSSDLGVQSGVLVVTFSESHFWKMGVAKQVAIDDVTSRLLTVLDGNPHQLSPLQLPRVPWASWDTAP